jgi:1-acyl-sn-glycerol-3-phosphate acyltransferase
MERFALSHDVPYQFVAPRPSRLWICLTRPILRHILRKTLRVVDVRFEEVGRLRELLTTGARLLIAPNHSDHADALAQFEIAHEVDTLFCYMATHQLFAGSIGLRKRLLPLWGVFPIDREGSALAALKTARDVLVQKKHPLVVYPEGEVYHTSDRLTPLREGVAAMALTSQKALGADTAVMIVPVAMKYRYVAPLVLLPELERQLGSLERRFTWRSNSTRPLSDRLYRFGEGLLALKEVEVLGSPSSGAADARVTHLRHTLLSRIEQQHLGRIGTGELPERINAVRRHCVDILRNPEATRGDLAACRESLDDVFLVVQLFSYPGDYVRENPTVERIAETLMKFEEDLTGQPHVSPLGDRRLTVRIGEPIDVREFTVEKSRGSVSACTQNLQRHLQQALDQIGPGNPVAA